jgi:hypothetical protein
MCELKKPYMLYVSIVGEVHVKGGVKNDVGASFFT